MSGNHNNIALEIKQPRRVNWVDYAKGIGIFLVVLGHTIRGLVNSAILPSSTIVKVSDQWIYAFHMPLFFFLSGLFIERSIEKPLRDFIINRLKVIAYPYLVWSLLQSLLQVMTSRYTNHPLLLTDLWRILYQPIMQFWFLYTLFVILVVYAIAHKLGASSAIFLLISIGVYCLYSSGINLGSWGVIYLVCRYALYLSLGALIGSQFNMLPRLIEVKTWTLLILIWSGFFLVGFAVRLNVVENTWAVPLVAILGITSAIALAILLERFDVAHFVEQWGRLSLEIYVVHTIASAMLRIVLQKLFGFVEPVPHLILGTIIGIYAPIGLALICHRIGFRYLFTFAAR